jgi:hypothetical protein
MTSSRPLRRRVLLVVIALLGATAQTPAPTELVIHAVGPAGQPLTISGAELYLDYWGSGDTVVLPTSGATVRVPLGRDWLCREHPDLCEAGYLAARIVLRATGYASIASDRFAWIGSIEDPNDFANRASQPARVRFPTQDPWVFHAGTSRVVTMTFRRAEPRRLKLVDQSGKGVPGATVTVIELMARSNHTGHPEGPVVVQRARTDERGMVAVPDADLTYAFRVAKSHHQLIGDVDGVLEMRLTAPITRVPLRRLARRPLRLAFVGRPVDVAKIPVRACVINCSSGEACCGPLGETDAQGRLTIEDFYPDEFESVFVPGEGTTRRWEIEPRKLGTGRLTIPLR